ncbi:hypothetical protein B0T21DRAFT_381128 [Apiosordaria backusii]|uniref:CCHC-type domain-containing protein n=1 Tax=Apiosordaria backusii TaxID=314023 RepID=A0AA40ET55_9PEZI|nr:hypothetical protein B0T21DRAFT_381128 [Apiosordaria backusii]
MDRIRQDQGELPLGDFRQCPSARKLFDFLGRAFPVKVNKQRTLNSFIIWLIERLIIDKDVSDPSSAESELKEWYQLLRSCRIDDQTIIDGYIQSEHDHILKYPLDARRLHMFEQELRELMKIPPPFSQAPGQVPPAHDPSTIALAKAKDPYTRPGRKLSAQMAQNSSTASSKPMDDNIHPDRRRSVPRASEFSAVALSKSMDDYIHPDRRVSVPVARSDSITAPGADMSDYIHPGRRSLVSTARESPKHASSASTFAHMHPDRVPSASNPHSSSPAPEVMYGHMHPDRLKVSRDAALEPGELMEEGVQSIEGNRTGTGRQAKGNKFDPSCPDLPYLSGANAMALEALEKEKEKEKEKEPDLSFLTGSNRMVFNDDTGTLPEKKKKKSSRQTKPSEKRPDEPPLNHAGKKEYTVPGSYVCNRCNIRGHLIQDCPTNGDWRFAVKAPADYTCKNCGKQADHYIGDCPKRSSRDSHNLQVEPGSPRRVVSDSYRPEPRAHKRRHSGDSDIMEVNSSAWRSRSRRKRGRGSQRTDDEPDRAFSIRGSAKRDDCRWGKSANVVLRYVDQDKPAGNESPPRAFPSRRLPAFSPDPREEGRLSYYDEPSEETQSKKSLPERVTLPRKKKKVVPKIEALPIRVASASPRIRVDSNAVGRMIEEEKMKDDLIPAFFKLFLNKEVHRMTKGKRPVATDLIEMPPESEEGDDDVMEVDQAPSFVKCEQLDRSFLGTEMDESVQRANVSVIQHLHGVIDVDDDVVMTEARRPSLIVSGLGDITDLTELSDDDSQTDIVVVDD